MSKAGSSGMIIRGMTFYKSEPDPMVADDGEPGENCECNLSVTLSGIKATREVFKERSVYSGCIIIFICTVQDVS